MVSFRSQGYGGGTKLTTLDPAAMTRNPPANVLGALISRIYMDLFTWRFLKIGAPKTIQVMDDNDLVLKAMGTWGIAILRNPHLTSHTACFFAVFFLRCDELCYYVSFESMLVWLIGDPKWFEKHGKCSQEADRMKDWLVSFDHARHEHQFLANFKLPWLRKYPWKWAVVEVIVKHTFIWNPLDIVHDQTYFKRVHQVAIPTTQTMAHV